MHHGDISSSKDTAGGQMRLSFNAKLYRPGPSYRDDNRVLWQAHAGQSEAASNGKSSEQETGHDAAAPASPQHVPRYREWDSLISRYRPDWCSVIEAAPSLSTQARPAPALNRARFRPRAVAASRLGAAPDQSRAAPLHDSSDNEPSPFRQLPRRTPSACAGLRF